ncbi:hypothetical protein MTR67_017815 [Solanum verrucosum]|uniref:Uncharacterized protein n=1 Tax=Solanum verrucosum TaxID=315347 RepID=A0AAF0TSJ7_SOLVR|nr:hypothetical protein MTR67_017815 [Solanum verrucosum]
MNEKEDSDPILLQLKDAIHKEKVKIFCIGENEILRYQERLCVPDVDGFKDQILKEIHSFMHSIHLGTMKMYRDLREVF